MRQQKSASSFSRQTTTAGQRRSSPALSTARYGRERAPSCASMKRSTSMASSRAGACTSASRRHGAGSKRSRRCSSMLEAVRARRNECDAWPALGCPQDPKENSFPPQKSQTLSAESPTGMYVRATYTEKGTHAANLMLASSNRREASSVGGPSD